MISVTRDRLVYPNPRSRAIGVSSTQGLPVSKGCLPHGDWAVSGGMTHVDMWDLKSDRHGEFGRTLLINSKAGLEFNE